MPYDYFDAVDHSPIPAVTYYYIFEMDDVTYTISYESLATKEGLEYYRARVEEERDGEIEVTVYNFEYKKLLPMIWIMKYTGPEKI